MSGGLRAIQLVLFGGLEQKGMRGHGHILGNSPGAKQQNSRSPGSRKGVGRTEPGPAPAHPLRSPRLRFSGQQSVWGTHCGGVRAPFLGTPFAAALQHGVHLPHAVTVVGERLQGAVRQCQGWHSGQE